jgi:hypothetical protein
MSRHRRRHVKDSRAPGTDAGRVVDFDTDLVDLRASSTALQGAADAVGAALGGVRKQDVPTGPVVPDPFGGEMATVTNAFGDTLGMPHVANAYSEHLAAIEKLLGQLQQSTVDTSHALRQVADLYEEADEAGRRQMSARAAQLDAG